MTAQTFFFKLKFFFLFCLIYLTFLVQPSYAVIKIPSEVSTPAPDVQTQPSSDIDLIREFGLKGDPKQACENNPEGCDITKSNFEEPQKTQYALQNLMHAALCEMAGMSPAGKCLGLTLSPQDKLPKLKLFGEAPSGGALGYLTTALVAVYHPPTSTTLYIADLGKRFGVTPAYAQTQSVPGSGAGIIEPVRLLWQTFRNIAYIGFTVIFLIVGFMIMFRQRINPQTVVSAQAALPGLIIGLILVTFSYFIAAFLIDLAFIGVRLAAELFILANLPNWFSGQQDPSRLRDFAANSNIFHLFSISSFRLQNFSELLTGVLVTFNPAVDIGVIARSFLLGITGAIIGFFAGGPIGAAIGGSLGLFSSLSVPLLISLIVPLILIIALFFQLIRLLLALVSTYIQLLVATISGPFIILFSSLPGQGGRLSSWFRTLAANSLIFPAVFAAFLFAGMILGTPARAWNTTPPLFGGMPTELIRLLIAYGIILATPGIPEAIRTAFGIKGVSPFVQAAVAGFAAGMAPVGAGIGAGVRRWWVTTPRAQAGAYRRTYREEQLRAQARAELGIQNPPVGGGGQ